MVQENRANCILVNCRLDIARVVKTFTDEILELTNEQSQAVMNKNGHPVKVSVVRTSEFSTTQHVPLLTVAFVH